MSKQEKLKEKFKKRIAFYKQKSKRRSNIKKATVLHYNYDSETGKLIPHTSRVQRQMEHLLVIIQSNALIKTLKAKNLGIIES